MARVQKGASVSDEEIITPPLMQPWELRALPVARRDFDFMFVREEGQWFAADPVVSVRKDEAVEINRITRGGELVGFLINGTRVSLAPSDGPPKPVAPEVEPPAEPDVPAWLAESDHPLYGRGT